MNGISLVDGPFADDFFPFTQTRSVADIRCGILTIREKWELHLKNNSLPDVITIPSNILPGVELVNNIISGNYQSALDEASCLNNVSDILSQNGLEIEKDFQLITRGRNSMPVSTTNKITGSSIFIEPGAIVEHCFLNSSTGPIYIGRDALVMEGSMIRGPFAIGEKTVVKMGAKIYGATSAGPGSILGGEIKNSILFGNSNKSHDGYLGDSILGEWCNLGAGTSNSNMKNSVGRVKLWNPLKNKYIDGGEKCGLMMGDYSRTAIHTAFNTGTVVGVSCHVFGQGSPPAYLPSFSWGITGEIYSFEKAKEHIGRWKKLKNQALGPEEVTQLKIIFDQIKQL